MVVALKTIYRQQDVPSPEEFQKTYIKQFGPEPIDAIYHFSLEEDMMVTYFYNLITIFMHGDKSTIITGYCDLYNKYYSSCINSNNLKSIGVEMPFYRFSCTLRGIFFKNYIFVFRVCVLTSC